MGRRAVTREEVEAANNEACAAHCAWLRLKNLKGEKLAARWAERRYWQARRKADGLMRRYEG